MLKHVRVMLGSAHILNSATLEEKISLTDNESLPNNIGKFNMFSRRELESLFESKLPGNSLAFAIPPDAIRFEAAEGDFNMIGIAKRSIIRRNVIRTTFQSGMNTFSIEQSKENGYFVKLGRPFECYVAPRDVISLS